MMLKLMAMVVMAKVGVDNDGDADSGSRDDGCRECYAMMLRMETMMALVVPVVVVNARMMTLRVMVMMWMVVAMIPMISTTTNENKPPGSYVLAYCEVIGLAVDLIR